MSRKANPTVVGIFALGAVALLVAGVALFGGGKFFRPKLSYVAYFKGSAAGLRKGAAVNFRGVRIGSVTDIQVQVDADKQAMWIPVYFEIEPGRVTQLSGGGYPGEAKARASIQQMVDSGLRAQLVTESFVTGQLAVELDFMPDKPAEYVRLDGEVAEFPTVPSTLAELTSTLKDLPIEEIIAKLDRSLTGIDKVVNAPELADSVKSLPLAVADLRKLIRDVNDQIKPLALAMTETLGETRTLVRNVDRQIGPISKSLADGLADARKLVNHVNETGDPISEQLTGALGDTRKLVANVDGQVRPLAETFAKALADAQEAMRQATKTLAAAEGVVAKDSKLYHDLNRALEEFAGAARAIRLAAEYLQRHPEALFKGKGAEKGR